MAGEPYVVRPARPRSHLDFEKIMRFKKVLSFQELEGQGHDFIMRVTNMPTFFVGV